MSHYFGWNIQMDKNFRELYFSSGRLGFTQFYDAAKAMCSPTCAHCFEESTVTLTQCPNFIILSHRSMKTNTLKTASSFIKSLILNLTIF